MAKSKIGPVQRELLNEVKLKKTREERKRLYQMKEWYNIRAVMGNNWAFFYILLGARERGKSYSVMEYCLRQWRYHKIPFTWIRLNEASMKKMLSNNAAQMVDPDLYRRFGLNLVVKGNQVFDKHDDPKGKGELMATVLSISTAHNDKGVALFDKDYTGNFNIVLDEFQLEKSQRRTFDVSYNLVVELENLVRSRKEKIHIFMIGNTTEEASDILSMFNFIPQDFGVYKLKSKRAVIDYMPNSEAYNKRRKGTVGDILAGHTSNFTNNIETDVSLINKKRLHRPQYIIKFSKDKADWFTVWDDSTICKYNKEIKPGIAMRRYVDEQFSPEIRDQVFGQYDARAFKFNCLLTQKQFAYNLSLVKKQ